uniref:Uncharacterized protein n=1 Tax=Ixodes ricinus TaxID=34613 RepID=A0A6B0UFX2_IXORI
METVGRGSHSMAKIVGLVFFVLLTLTRKREIALNQIPLDLRELHAFARHFITATHISSRAVAKVDDFAICAKTHAHLFASLTDRLQLLAQLKLPFSV